MKNLSLLFSLLLLPFLGFSQDGTLTIKGTVFDDETNAPILGANILEKDTDNGTSSDIDGNFSIKVPKNGTLKISYVGYAPREIKISQLKLDELDNLELAMVPDAAGLDEVVVVGYGQQSKISTTASVSTVKPDKLRTASTNITSNLAGNLSGVIGVQRSGQPGADAANFFIRGISTYSGAQSPLILLDGVQISAGDLDNLTPEDIESVSVLKDATATAVYGNQGANGVLIITTKTGENLEKPKIHARAQVSVSSPTETPNFVDGVRYMKLFNEAVNTRGSGEILYSRDKIQGTAEGRNKYVYPNVDWYNELFKDMAFNQEANVNVRGGGEDVRYYLSADFKHQTGLLKSFDLNSFDNNIDIKRFNFQNNIDADLSPTTTVALKLNTQLVYDDGPAADVTGIYGGVMNSNPVDFPMYYPADSISHGRNINYGGRDGGRVNDGFPNPFADLTSGYSETFKSTVMASLRGEQKLDFITEGLSFKALVNFKNFASTTTTRSRGYNQYQINNYEQLDDGSYDYEIERIGDYQSLSLGTATAHGGDHRFDIQPSINYNHNFGKHNVGGLLVYNLKEWSTNVPDDLISSLPHRRMGYVGRVTYDFDHRYLFEANGAYNGTENFAKNKRFGFFPSLAAGYVISNENWFNSNFINLLKIKASWGKVGNDDIGGTRFPYISDIDLNGQGFTTGVDQNTSYNGPVYNQFENRAITWETADKWNFGLEFDILNGIDFHVDYYYEKRTDIFDDISSTIPNVFGTAGTKVFSNIGEVINKGVDFSVDFNKKISKDLRISAKGTFTYAHNKITVNNEPPFTEFPNLSSVGQSIGTPLGYLAERLFIDQAEINNSPIQQIGGDNISAGDVKYTDITGDGKITSDDRKFMGNPGVPEIIYGLSASVYYKNWDLSFLLQGAANTSFFINNFHPFGTQGIRNVLDFVANNRYRPDNPDIYAKYPKLSKKDNGNNTVNSSYWLRDGAFLKLRSAEIGYSWKNFRFFASGFNLLTFSKFKHWDPEEGGGSGLKYPTQRIINVGVQMSFN